MKNILLAFVSLLAITSYSQTDTSETQNQFIDSTILQQIEVDPTIFFDVGCAHGHICCYAGCSCCPELKRMQVYDTLTSEVTNGVRRVAVAERYAVAATHDIAPAHIRFFKNGEWTEEYYPVEDGRLTYTELLTRHPKTKNQEKPFYAKDVILVVDRSREYLQIDREGNEVPMTFQTTTAITPELSVGSLVLDNRVVSALLLPDGKAISRTKYLEIHPFNDEGLAIVYSISGTGLINKNGVEVIPTTAYSISKIGANRYAVQAMNGPTNIYDGQGNCLTKDEYNHIGTYSEGLVFARMHNNSLVFLDMNGKVAVRVKEEWAYDFHDGLAAVMQGGKWGYIDLKGKTVIPCTFYRALGFSDGAAPVATGQMNNEQWILIDKSGKQISSKSYSEIKEFKSGIAPTFINGVGYGFIDTKGNEVMECKYTDFGYGTPDHWDIDGMVVRSTIQDRKVLENSLEIVDLSGRRLASLESYMAYQVLPRNGNPVFGSYPFILVYKKDNKCNIVDFKGNTIIKSDYDNIMIYNEQLAVGVKNGQYFILNPTNGEVISNFGSKQINNIQFGIVTVISNINSDMYEHYDLKGKLLN